jgi:hypothetical protein
LLQEVDLKVQTDLQEIKDLLVLLDPKVIRGFPAEEELDGSFLEQTHR